MRRRSKWLRTGHFYLLARIFQKLERVSNHFLLKKQKKYQEDFIVLSLWGNINLLFLEKVVMIVNFHTRNLPNSPVYSDPPFIDFQEFAPSPCLLNPPCIWIPRVVINSIMIERSYQPVLQCLTLFRGGCANLNTPTQM